MPTAAQTAAVPTLQKYITNLQTAAKAGPLTAKQQAELTLYQNRLTQYTTGGTPTPTMAAAPASPAGPGAINLPAAYQAAGVAPAPLSTYQPGIVPQAPTAWGAPINLPAPSSDTYTLAQQYYYALHNPGLPGPDRNALFTMPAGQMQSQLQQLLMSVGASIKTQQYPGFTPGYAAAGNALYPDVPQAVYQYAGVAAEQFGPNSFYGQQVANQGYSLAVDPNIQGANSTPGVLIPYLQAEIAQKVDTATGKPLTASQVAARRVQLAALQKGYQASQAPQVYPVTYQGVPAGGGNSSSLMPTVTQTSPVTPQGSSTPTATNPLQTGTAGVPTPTVGADQPAGGGVSFTGGGGSDAGSPAVGGPFPQLSGAMGGLSILDLALIGGAGVAVLYAMRHGKRAPKGK